MSAESNLSVLAQGAFRAALDAADPEEAVRSVIKVDQAVLVVAGNRYELSEIRKVYAIGLGKAAFGMAFGLTSVLGGSLRGGVLSCPRVEPPLKLGEEFLSIWKVFHGGHPLPNRESIGAARTAIEMLDAVDASDTLVIFLVSGGGSAMLDLPVDDQISLPALREMNRVLVSCGATIAEINSIRQRLSLVKGGKLGGRLSKARQMTLIVSDTNRGDECGVASGPAAANVNDIDDGEIREIVNRYGLDKTLPPAILAQLGREQPTSPNHRNHLDPARQRSHLLLENQTAIDAACRFLEAHGLVVEIADDLVEVPVQDGCTSLVERLSWMRERIDPEKKVAVVSGGEFVCPVRGDGFGGRNSESALRTAILLDQLRRNDPGLNIKVMTLFAGTDGIDGNSSSAGAIADEMTLERGRAAGLDASKALAKSDSHSYFAAIGDTVEPGVTGTNVRDIRILIAA